MIEPTAGFAEPEPAAAPAAATAKQRASAARSQRAAPSDRRVYEVLDGGLPLLTLQVAHEVGFFDVLAAGAASTSEVAAATGLPAASVATVALAAEALDLVRVADGRLRALPAALEYFSSGERSMAPMFAYCRTQPWTAAAYVAVREALLDPDPGSRGPRFWRWIESDRERVKAFAAAMEAHSAPLATRWPRLAPLRQHRELLDLGGGTGTHALAAAAAAPELRVTVCDSPAVVAIGRERMRGAAPGSRVEFRALDLLADTLPTADLHLLADVLHDLPEVHARELVRRSFEALPSGGRLLVLEMILDESGRGPFAVVASAVAIYLATGGRQYRGSELAAFMADAGFRGVRARPVLGFWQLLLARKP